MGTWQKYAEMFDIDILPSVISIGVIQGR